MIIGSRLLPIAQFSRLLRVPSGLLAVSVERHPLTHVPTLPAGCFSDAEL